MSPTAALEEALLRRLDRFAEELRELELPGEPADGERIGRLLVELSRFIEDEDAQLAFAALASDRELESRCRYIQAAAARACSALELAQARAAGRDPLGVDRYLGEVSGLALLDLRDAGISRASRVLFIGSGAFPITAITLAQRVGCPVLCYDVSEPAAAASRELLRALGLAGRVEVAAGPEGGLDVAGFTHVCIASLVPDKERVLERLRPRLAPGAAVLVRYGNGLKGLFNYGLGPLPEDRWRLLHRCDERGHLYDTVLLRPLS